MENNETVESYDVSYKKIAVNALKGNWRVAIITSLAASLLCAEIFGLTSDYFSSLLRSINDLGGLYLSGMPEEMRIFVIIYVIDFCLCLFMMLVSLLIGGVGRMGYAMYNLKLIDRKHAVFSDLFSQFRRFKSGFALNLLSGLYVFLWSLLFVIPGIVKRFSYSMAPFILAEHPEMSARQALKESRRMMKGHKGELFGLQFSFVGWALLCTVPCVVAILLITGLSGLMIGNESLTNLIWILPFYLIMYVGLVVLGAYESASFAAFYRDLQAEQAEANMEE